MQDKNIQQGNINCSYNIEKLSQYVNKQFDQSIRPSLQDYIRIPNMSKDFDSKWDQNGLLLKAAQHIKKWVDSQGIKGLKCQIIKDQGYTPLIFTQIQGQIDQTVFFYGHYDKQPPFEGWLEGLSPTEPKVIQGKLYGRGGADDGYSTYGTLLAIKALIEQGLKIPRCVMITEGDQQSGSGDMSYYLPKLKQRIGNPSVFFCLDSGTFNYDTLWLTNSLRGCVNGTLRVQTLKQGIHSGDISGVVPSCFRIARHLLSRIQSFETGQINQKFQTTIPANRYKQTYDLAHLKGGQEAIQMFPFLQGVEKISNDPLTCLLNRNWKPTLTIIGETGFPLVKDAGNVLNPFIEIKFSLRLPPNLNNLQAEQHIREILTTNVPYKAKVQVKNIKSANGWNAPKYEEYLQKAANQASQIYYKNPRMGLGEGGSIPLINSLNQYWPKGQFIVTGVLGPNSNAHGPNQCLDIGYTKKVICCISHILAAVSQNFEKSK